MSSNKKTIIKTIFVVLLVQTWIVGSLWAFFYYNYETYATAKSGISNKIELTTKKIDFKKIKLEVEEKQENKSKNFYEWKLWVIKETFTKKKSKWKLSEIKILSFDLKREEIKKIILINILKDKNLLDKYTYQYLSNVKENKIEIELNKFLNFHILLWNLDKANIEWYKKQWLKEYKAFIIRTTILIKQDRYDMLSDDLKELEEEYLETFTLKKQNLPSWSILLSENVQYVLSKLLNDEYYKKNIEKASNELEINKNLLVTSVWVEQVRHMTTTRWYAKNLIKQNKYLTNFSKFSYWLGWIKVKTARKIQANTQLYNLEAYNKYFLKDKDLKDHELIETLTMDYNWLLYASSLIYNIQKRWSDSWYDLTNKPWVIVTLYNMWNPADKAPHSTPDLGWSLININWKKLYFWEIWYLLYHYLEYYID